MRLFGAQHASASHTTRAPFTIILGINNAKRFFDLCCCCCQSSQPPRSPPPPPPPKKITNEKKKYSVEIIRIRKKKTNFNHHIFLNIISIDRSKSNQKES